MKRGKPMKRSGYLNRYTPIAKVNEKRAKKKRELDFAELADFCKERECSACPAPAPSDAAHVTSRGACGHAWNDDGSGNIIPLCRKCHDEQHAHGWSAIFEGGQAAAKLVAMGVGMIFEAREISK